MTPYIIGLWQLATLARYMPIPLKKTVSHKQWIILIINLPIGTFIKMWNAQMDSAILRAVHFLDNYQNIVIFGLEKGEM